MPLDKNFIFSAHNLQDFLDCPRRFELKHILKQDWPAIISQPVQEMENKIQTGNRFHHLAHQYLSGIPGDLLLNSTSDPDLLNWFAKFQEYISRFETFPHFSEFSIFMPFEGYRMVAVFDFITMTDKKKMVIADWKTTSRLPKKATYIQSIQSHLYPFIAYETRQSIFNNTDFLQPQDISMEYWFPAFPEAAITLEYSSAGLAASRELLARLISEISNTTLSAFEKTTNVKRCAYCQYRSLCERGIQAGEFEDTEHESDSDASLDDLDFDQIDEIAF